jgi:peroxiredoxin
MNLAIVEDKPSLLHYEMLTGTNAPDFVLPSNTGKDISLKSLAGKRTVLYFYPVSRICSDALLFSLPVDCSVCSDSSFSLSGEKNMR